MISCMLFIIESSLKVRALSSSCGDGAEACLLYSFDVECLLAVSEISCQFIESRAHEGKNIDSKRGGAIDLRFSCCARGNRMDAYEVNDALKNLGAE